MGNCCGSAEQDEKEKNNSYQAGGENDLSDGPCQNRGCTDIICVPIFIAHWVVFFIIVLAGASAGDPTKLYKPRDFRGAYCDVSSNWNNGPVTTGFPKLTYMMNVSSTTDMVAKQFLCSSVATGELRGLLSTAELDTYLCGCCLVPCDSCDGAVNNGGDISSLAGLSTIQGRMADLTNPANAASLANPSSLNGDMFTNMWAEATKYFNAVCIDSCATNYATISNMSATRTVTYQPSLDNVLSFAWTKLKNEGSSTMQSLIANSFTYQAFPTSVCPYEDASKCVPMLGVDFEEVVAGSGYCTFKMAAEATAAVGASAAAAFEGLGGDALANSATEGFGEWMGHILSTIDSIIIMAVLSFVIGLLFLILLRFTVGICVWLAVLITILIFPLGGAMAFVRSGQCSGAGFFDTGVQVGVSVAVAGTTAVSDAISGNTVSEAMTGNGADYRGRQRFTTSGKTCDDWSNHPIYTYKNGTDYSAMLANAVDYCRNPYNSTDTNIARTIWCYTTDTTTPWELCLPVGVIQPECAHGYAVEGQTMRDVLKWCAYIIWALGIVWIIIVFCFASRIRLAVRLNKVAAQFLAQNPIVLTVPICQAIVGVIWVLFWAFLAAFLVSQVPDTYTPMGAYETYGEAYGIDGSGWLESGTPGACTDKWPTGGVWKDETGCEMINGTTPACWRCFPPRYVLDYAFAYAFFTFLWANAFNIALGQIIIAGAVAAWFFAPNKGSDPVLKMSLWNTFRYHIGTVAFGSFIIAVIQFIRAVMKYLEKQAQAQKNKIMVLVFKIVGCCIWCFEKCMKFLNKNAYIQTALMGTNFCTSAKKAFFLILRNAIRFGAVAVLGQIVHGIGVFCITAGTVFLGYFIVRSMHDDIPPLMPMLAFTGIGYVVSQLFMSVFGMAVDTSLQCFIATEEMGGSPNVPEILQSTLPPAGSDGGEYKE